MRWPWQKKSNFDCSFYDSKKKEQPKEKPKTPNKIIEFPKTELDKIISDSFKAANDTWKQVEKQLKNNLGEKKVEQILIARGAGKPLSERLTNKKFGLYVNYKADDDSVTLNSDYMMVAILMDIRERLDTLIELNTTRIKSTKPKKVVTKKI